LRSKWAVGKAVRDVGDGFRDGQRAAFLSDILEGFAVRAQSLGDGTRSGLVVDDTRVCRAFHDARLGVGGCRGFYAFLGDSADVAESVFDDFGDSSL
jgi:hypothetical protein